MDNFTIAVLVGDALVVISLIALMVLDKGTPAPVVAEPIKPTVKPSGKKSA
jgi:hypothetical protein